MAVERVKITGVKFFKGNVEGTDYDNGNVFIEEHLDFTTGRAKGYASQLYKCGNSEVAKILMANNEFPLVADVDFMRVTNGDVTKNIVQSIIPVPRSQEFQKPGTSPASAPEKKAA